MGFLEFPRNLDFNCKSVRLSLHLSMEWEFLCLCMAFWNIVLERNKHDAHFTGSVSWYIKTTKLKATKRVDEIGKIY